MREIRNLEAAERLVKKYRSITREELAKVYASICEEESNEMRDVLQEITGFGSLSKCFLCTAIVEDNIVLVHTVSIGILEILQPLVFIMKHMRL